jgi:hypothetical protein
MKKKKEKPGSTDDESDVKKTVLKEKPKKPTNQQGEN